MYNWQRWLDHVTRPSNVFKVVDNKDGTWTITPAGTVMQQGTPQDQTHFNNMEAGILDAHTAISLLTNFARQNAWEIERGTIKLTNTLKFPFNNSQKTIALKTVRDITDYAVIVDVTGFVGNVGDIEITDKLINGFKLAYNGGASEATIDYVVIGGYLK